MNLRPLPFKIFHSLSGTLIFTSLLAFTTALIGQGDLNMFEPVVDKTWSATGTWSDGSPFAQQVTLRYGLNNTVVLTESNGFIDTSKHHIGPRNHGVRQFNTSTGIVEFWEFDVFGGMTKGIVRGMGRDMYYVYYYGSQLLTDKWEYVNDSTYKFTVGVMKDGEWTNTYLSTVFTLMEDCTYPIEAPDLATRLTGQWHANAWSGKLAEIWWTGHDGSMHQTAIYEENGIVQYQAKNRIMQVGRDIVLVTVIDGADPKVFKAISYSPVHITFQNNEYANPHTVHYTFDDERGFHRTISGQEDGKDSVYTFHFLPVTGAGK